MSCLRCSNAVSPPPPPFDAAPRPPVPAERPNQRSSPWVRRADVFSCLHGGLQGGIVHRAPLVRSHHWPDRPPGGGASSQLATPACEAPPRSTSRRATANRARQSDQGGTRVPADARLWSATAPARPAGADCYVEGTGTPNLNGITSISQRAVTLGADKATTFAHHNERHDRATQIMDGLSRQIH